MTHGEGMQKALLFEALLYSTSQKVRNTFAKRYQGRTTSRKQFQLENTIGDLCVKGKYGFSYKKLKFYELVGSFFSPSLPTFIFSGRENYGSRFQSF
jgi:hypothetical protein